MEVIFTLNAHYAEYTTNKGTDEEPNYGDIDDATVIISKRVCGDATEINKYIEELAEIYEVSKEDIAYYLVQCELNNKTP